MNRRRLLVVGASLVVTAGCTGQSTESTDTPDSTTETPTPTETASPQETHSPPYTFATVRNAHESTQTIRVRIETASSGEKMVDETRQVQPGYKNNFDITDEWLHEEGDYRVTAENEDGQRTSMEVEADESWTCIHTIDISISPDGELKSMLSSAMRKGC